MYKTGVRTTRIRKERWRSESRPPQPGDPGVSVSDLSDASSLPSDSVSGVSRDNKALSPSSGRFMLFARNASKVLTGRGCVLSHTLDSLRTRR